VQGAARSNRAAPTRLQAQAVNTFYSQGVNSFSLSNSALALALEDVRDSFIRSSVDKSPKTLSTLSERLRPFTAYLDGIGILGPLHITREHVDGFLIEIAKGRRGNLLSPARVFGFAKEHRDPTTFSLTGLITEDGDT